MLGFSDTYLLWFQQNFHINIFSLSLQKVKVFLHALWCKYSTLSITTVKRETTESATEVVDIFSNSLEIVSPSHVTQREVTSKLISDAPWPLFL